MTKTWKAINWAETRIEEEFAPFPKGSFVEFAVYESATQNLLHREKMPLLHQNICNWCGHSARLILWMPERTPRRLALLKRYFKVRESSWSVVQMKSKGYIVAGFRAHGLDENWCGHALIAGPGQQFSVGLSDFIDRMQMHSQAMRKKPRGFDDLLKEVREAGAGASEPHVMKALMRDENEHPVLKEARLRVLRDTVPAQTFIVGAVRPQPLLAFGSITTGWNWHLPETVRVLEYLHGVLRENQRGDIA